MTMTMADDDDNHDCANGFGSIDITSSSSTGSKMTMTMADDGDDDDDNHDCANGIGSIDLISFSSTGPKMTMTLTDDYDDNGDDDDNQSQSQSQSLFFETTPWDFPIKEGSQSHTSNKQNGQRTTKENKRLVQLS